MKTFIVILIILILAGVFLPIYNGKVTCGINPEKGCWNNKINLIEYIILKTV